MTTPPAVSEVAHSLAAFSHGLQRWAIRLEHELAAHRGVLTAVAVERIVKPAVDAMIADPTSDIAGAGFVAAPGLLGNDRYFMAWWQGRPAERVDPVANLSESAPERYLAADWYRDPIRTGLLTITGPYVDFLCTDEFALTYTAPVGPNRPAGPAGVVGIDVTAAALERRIARLLKAVSADAALVNAENRTIVTSSPLVAPGDLLDGQSPSWPIGHGLSVVG
ncbi:cache domain-containing protein [Gordonia sp. (in: high G+C Gram-positive bacteria)]|uniref:cache domain-containing protein n=1 Tax=Gordonia sp. (in: high G+C Gram-positive bacteria) TaxID=84139 RepID=UPI003C72A2D9